VVGKMKYQSILDDIVGEYFPVGTPDEEGIVFSALDEQVMKFGSLQHDTIDWEGIISNSHRYLSESCKDYKVLQYLGYALLYKGFKSNLVDFLSLFSEFNKKFLFNAYPKPSTDNTVNRFKGKFITLIFERLENAASNNTDVRFTAIEYEQIEQLIEELSLQLSEKLPSVESTLSRLRRFVKEQSDFIVNSQTKEESKTVPGQTAIDTPITASQVSAENVPLNIPDVNKFELANARQLKQFYFQVADTSCELQPSSILGYVSRRFGLWHSITQLPEMNSQGITAMQSVPLDKVSDYRELVISSPSVELLNRIEKTLTTSPYWIEGSYLSAKCCQALKFKEAAETIRSVTEQFVNRFPTFHLAKFQNGEPFLSDIVSDWLSDNNSVNVSTQASVQNSLESDLDELYSAEGFVSVLKKIDEQLKSVIDVRTKHYLQFEKIRFFLKEDMLSIALNELSELINHCKKYTVEEWDSTFFTQIEQLKDKLLKDNE